MTTKTTGAYSQQTEQMLEGQLRTIDADYRRLFEQKSDALINVLFAKLHRLLIAEVEPPEERMAFRIVFHAEHFDNGVEFNASAACYNRDGVEVGALDELLRAGDYFEVERLLGELNTLYSPFDGGESLELRLGAGRYVLIV
jgi:hypothetical protein